MRRAETFEVISAETRQKIAQALDVAVESLWPPVEIGSVIAGPDGATRLIGRTHGGDWLTEPVSFGPVEVYTAAELRATFGFEPAEPQRRADRHGFEALAEASRRNAPAIERSTRQARVEQGKDRRRRGRGLGADGGDSR